MQFSTIYKQHTPAIISWIQTTLAQHSSNKIELSKSAYNRLLDHFPSAFLEKAYVIYVNEVPVVPIYSGIPQLDFMSQLPAAGITFLDTFFIRNDEKHNIDIHFHELIHVIQWQYLGMEKFLLCYGYGLLSEGYRNSPLEKMAYDLEDRFSAGEIFDAIAVVHELMEPIEKLSEELMR